MQNPVTEVVQVPMGKRSFVLAATAVVVILLVCPSASPAQDQLVLGLPSYLSTTELYQHFGPLADHLSRKLNIPVKIRSESDYGDNLMNLKNGDVDIAFLGPASYVLYTRRFGTVPLLAAFESNGSKTFRGFIVVRKDSAIMRLSQLKGKKVAFSDRKSTMGHIVPRYLMLQAGIDMQQLGGHRFLDNQENVALGVMSGAFDAGAVRESIYQRYAGEGLRAIAASEPMPDHLFVARAGLPKATVSRISDILLSLRDSDEGRWILSLIQKDLTALVPVSDADYDPLRKIIERLTRAGVRL